MSLDPLLLEVLACPEDKGPVLYFPDEDTLYNPRLRRRYVIDAEVPVMLLDQAQTATEEEHQRLVAKAESEQIQPTFEP